jgi:hypothetical protein
MPKEEGSIKIRHLLAALATAGALLLVVAAPATTAAAAPEAVPVQAASYVLSVGGVGDVLPPFNVTFSDAAFSITSNQDNGKTLPPSVTLKRGTDGGGEIWQWHKLALRGIDTARVGATITARAADGTVLKRYELTNAWPTKVAIQGPVKGEAGVVVNSVTIVCDVITVISPP